jgi:hypothetical protein
LGEAFDAGEQAIGSEVESLLVARWTFGTWMRQGLAATGVLAGVVVVLWFRCEDRWHAELAFEDYACDPVGVCPMRPKIKRSSADATGHLYRFTTNTAGFRGPEWPAPGPHSGTFRIAVLGSSPVFGLGVEDGETLPAQLPARLSELVPERRVEVLNLGLPENYLASQLVTYARYVRPLEPDLVVFVQAELRQTRDMNARLRQLDESPVLRALLASAWTRPLVNRIQYFSMSWNKHHEDEAARLLPGRFRPLVEDQAKRDLRLWFFHFAGELKADAGLIPTGLRYGRSQSGLDWNTYAGGPFALPGDGHPNADGQAHFADMLAAQLAPVVGAGSN